ncbi:MAG: hypothetical protein J4G05_12305 [Chlorobi bacterium]|nr:hypothetical protein [Chlorobiota bacterium]
MPELDPPVAKRIPYESHLHDLILTDNYRWLREQRNPEVISYLEEENAYTEKMTAHTL